MIKESRCEELVTGNGKKYKFRGTIKNMERLYYLSGDPGKLFNKLASEDEKYPIPDIKNAIMCTMHEVDGVDSSELDVNGLSEEFVEDFGYHDCSLLIRHLINHGIGGDVKKKQIARNQALSGMSRKLRISHLMSTKKLGWLSGILLVSMTVLACTTFNLLWTRFA